MRSPRPALRCGASCAGATRCARWSRRSEFGRLLGAAATLAGLPGADLHGLLDPSPLRGTLERLVDFKRIARNVEDGTLTAAAVVATAYATTRSVVFHHGGPELGLDPAHAIDYFATPLAPEHVLASAAIPGAFPGGRGPPPARGQRLVRRRRRAPECTAQAGARAGRRPRDRDRPELVADRTARRPARPDAIDGAAQLLQVVLGDQLADDVATLATVNETLVPSGSSAGRARARHGGRRTIPYIFIAPSDRLEIGRLARDIYKRHYAGIGGLCATPTSRCWGGVVNAERSAVHGELLSYLFLARQFIEELIELGRRDGERWVEQRHDAGLWQVGRLPAVKTGSARGRRRSAKPRVIRAARAARA